MIHNDRFVFEQDAPAHDRMAFRGIPTRIELRPGTRLFRIITPKQNEFFQSPWWFTKQTLDELVRVSRATGRSMTEVARSRLAVRTNWSETFDWLAIVMLVKATYAWRGPAQYQPLSSSKIDSNVLLLGNFEQLYVPNLAKLGDGAGATSDIAKWEYYGELNGRI